MTIQSHNLCLPALPLPSDEVHVWCIALDQPSNVQATLAGLLAADEQTRAAQFYFERDRRACIVCYGWLRVRLGRYLGIDPQHLEFERGPYGKPALAPSSDTTGLQFNLSHSHQIALYAMTRQREIGIDLEYIRPMPDMEHIVARFFTPSEHVAFKALPADRRLATFFRVWTCKEAYLKAIGAGLMRPLADFEVSLFPDDSPRLLHDIHDPHAVERWSFHTFIPAAGYVATLCVDGHDWRLVCYDDGGTGGDSGTCATSTTPGACVGLRSVPSVDNVRP